jgi:hypothetical protein
VELLINGKVVNTVASEDLNAINVFKYVWTPSQAGSYLIQVRAQDTDGEWSNYEQVAVSVQEPPQPSPEPTNTTAPDPTAVPFTIFDVKATPFNFYYGDDSCGSNTITISAQVNYPESVYSMVIFTRFADQNSNALTGWDSGAAMTRLADGTYRITLNATELDNYDTYEFSTLFYQIVATRENKSELGRTVVLKNAHLEICPQPNTPSNVRFKNYTHDVDTFYYGSGACGATAVTISTDVTRPEKMEYVIVFTRFKDKYGADQTGWDGGTTMKVIDADTHRITLQASQLDNYDTYPAARMSYQFIATDKDGAITGRSLVFDDISLEVCN